MSSFSKSTKLISTAIALLISVVLTAALIAKLGALQQLRESLSAAHVVPASFVGFAMALVLGLEGLTALGLLMPSTRLWASNLAMFLFTLFALYSGWRLVFQIAVPCSCFGTIFTMSPLASLLLNCVLLALSGEVSHRTRVQFP